jgi:hypothetical protein
MSNSHIQSSFRRSIRRKPVFHLPEVSLGPGVARHEYNGANGDLSLKEPVGRDDRANRVCVQVESEFVKGTALLNQYRSYSVSAEGVHPKMHALAKTRKVRTARWLAARVSAALVCVGLHGRWDLRLGSGGRQRSARHSRF